MGRLNTLQKNLDPHTETAEAEAEAETEPEVAKTFLGRGP